MKPTIDLTRPEMLRLLGSVRIAIASSYSPYSRYAVGASLLATDGRIFHGANVENCSYGLTICAERVALFKAVTEGAREFSALALTVSTGRAATPCGACRQVLAEFCSDLPILVVTSDPDVRILWLSELIPACFTRADLGL